MKKVIRANTLSVDTLPGTFGFGMITTHSVIRPAGHRCIKLPLISLQAFGKT